MAGPRGAQLSTPATDATTWHPTVLNVVVLIILEIVAYCALRWAFRSAHGG